MHRRNEDGKVNVDLSAGLSVTCLECTMKERANIRHCAAFSGASHFSSCVADALLLLAQIQTPWLVFYESLQFYNPWSDTEKIQRPICALPWQVLIDLRPAT